MIPRRLRRVLLVGFMGAGKSSVGAVVASALGWRFLDFDDVIEAEAGSTVREIFARRGEPYFRALEARVARELLARDEVVLGSGGGWAAVPGRLDDLPEGTETFWLRVSAEGALQRLRDQPGSRPLLDVADPLREASVLLERRSEAYRRARWAVDTEGRTVDDVSARILEILDREHPNRGAR